MSLFCSKPNARKDGSRRSLIRRMHRFGQATRARSDRGFNIVELLTVMGVVLALAAFTIPQGLQYIRAYKLRTAAAAISGKLMDARISAIKRNRSVRLRVDNNTRTAEMRTTDNTGATVTIGVAERFPDGINLDSESVEVVFDSMGRPTAGTQTIRYVHPSISRSIAIEVSPAGKISVADFQRIY